MKRNSLFAKNNKETWGVVIFLVLLLITGLSINRTGINLSDTWSNFATVFLGIFIEAIPFLLLGTLASGFVEVYIREDVIERLMPRSSWSGVLLGALMGLAFPVCECGVVPLVRRLYKKGLPFSTGIAFLLAAPVINPIVILSTAAAFGVGRMLWMRLGFTILTAFLTGLVFSTVEDPAEILQPNEAAGICACEHHPHLESVSENVSIKDRLIRIMQIAMEELFEMGRFLVIGALISAAMQTFIPQTVLLSLGGGVLSSILVMITLAILLSICSTVDSFVALGFLGTFTNASILSFLLYGPMVDIKSVLMFTHVFKRRAVMYLLLIPLVIIILITVSLDYYWI